MGKHFLGKKMDGKTCLYRTHVWNDEEFEQLIKEIGGFLPPTWMAWHLDNNETVASGSKRAAALAKLPSVILLYGAEPSKNWIKEMLLEDMQKYKESIGAAN
jgi:hypothetical protein